ncbi:hypothetical protein PybrP1_004259 [[Pythium] brassicae (nom. inval.)]|nr:hypothetical protein PybrP1_004259 [[Pythium] brassicae (nom. inval.)]
MADQIICISDDEQEDATRAPVSAPAAGGDSDSDGVKAESIAEPRGLTPGKRRSSTSSSSLVTPERKRKRRSVLDGARRESGASLKPLTPSMAVNSSMNASLVFDMVTSLSTNDPGAAIATLRSIVVLGKEYPSNLLYDELVDRILSVEAVAYADAVSIYASLVFVFDKASTCSCAVSYPHQWEPLAAALQDASANAADDAWRRSLLVLQFFVYCLQQDLAACRQRYAAREPDAWVLRTRVFALLQSDAGERKAKSKIRNNLILQAIGCGLQLWKRVFDGGAKATPVPFRREAEDACMAALRLIEMVYLCTTQVENILQRIQAGVVELSRATRVRFAQAIQSPDLKVRVATTVMGLTNKSRSTEFEWYESNATGRIMHAIAGGACGRPTTS